MGKIISISLTVDQWNVIMTALAHRPFIEVAELISVIKTQATPQVDGKSTEE